MAKPRLPHFDQHPSAFLLISTMRSWLPVSILLPSFFLEEVAASFWWSRAVPLLLSALHPQRAILPTTCTSAHYLQQSLSRTRQRRPTPRRRLLPTAFVVVEQESHAPTFEAILLPLETSQAARPTSQHAFDSNVSCIYLLFNHPKLAFITFEDKQDAVGNVSNRSNVNAEQAKEKSMRASE